jgi:hypothetical protein
MDACPRCRLAARLERDHRIVREEIDALRENLTRDLDLDARLDLVASEVELLRLLDAIEQRRQAVLV